MAQIDKSMLTRSIENTGRQLAHRRADWQSHLRAVELGFDKPLTHPVCPPPERFRGQSLGKRPRRPSGISR